MKNPKRNFGKGKGLKFSAKEALREIKGNRFATISTHCHRFNLFADFCKKNNTNNAVYITQDLFELYALRILDRVLVGDISTHYAHNLISSINVVMHAFRRDKCIWLSPKILFGPRCHVRKIAPNMSLFVLKQACRKISIKAGFDIALLIWLARVLGLRLREAILLDAKKSLKETKSKGHVDIRKGTKGGRGKKVERLVKSNKRVVFALEMAVVAQSNRVSFIPKSEKLITFYRRIHNIALPILKEFGIEKIHDLRAAFACDDYKNELGIEAPVISGKSVTKTPEIKEKLKKISNKLGHNREYIIDSYCGR
ncbi:integrase domain-containing protein [Colwellia sp. BRX8-4]|uniref:integrase domain-containing protein n=1 Tax=Colwellia sp. BRX8-4 TaxID=2759836 RepID=UPI0015F6E770|nr:integrase domain-containing protein [Colwellia sp. BRX8-4]MBA6371498.1 integrase domain-containing protein [Colwellia sp. BRX8-4]